MKHKSAWGNNMGLIGEYKNEYAGEVKTYKIGKKELDEVLKEMEMKNRYKNKQVVGVKYE